MKSVVEVKLTVCSDQGLFVLNSDPGSDCSSKTLATWYYFHVGCYNVMILLLVVLYNHGCNFHMGCYSR